MKQAFVILTATFFLIDPVFAACGKFQNPMQTAWNQLDSDTSQIFKRLGSGPNENQAKQPEKAEADFLIVPGVRAGSIEIGASYQNVSSQMALGRLVSKMDDQYLYILKVGYVPPRQVAEVSKQKIRLAFTEDQKLSEIFVQDPKYQTDHQIGVGSARARLMGLEKWSTKKSKGLEYLQGNGLTLILRQDQVIEVVVTRKTGPS